MAYETIRYAVDDGIATLTLARPERLNAISGLMIREIIAALDDADADDAVRAMIATGEGRAFCAGGVLALRLFRALKPVIGAINGAAVGLGATMTLPMDIRLASDSARYGFVFARRGMVPEAASSFFLPRLVGISRALGWCYSGRLVGAEEALAGGLVSAVHSAENLLPAARAIAREIAENCAPVSIALTRQMMWRGLTMAHPMEAHRIESYGTIARGRMADAAEGVGAFLEKRLPAFPDRVSADMPEFFPWWDDPAFS